MRLFRKKSRPAQDSMWPVHDSINLFPGDRLEVVVEDAGTHLFIRAPSKETAVFFTGIGLHWTLLPTMELDNLQRYWDTRGGRRKVKRYCDDR